MTIDDFSSLKEIQSLDNMIKKHLDIIDDEKKREIFINNQKEKKSVLLHELNEKITQNQSLTSKLETRLFELEKIQSQAKQSLNLAKNEQQAKLAEKQLQNSSLEHTELEDKILMTMEQEEELISERQDVKTFLIGVEKTLSEVKVEIEQVSSTEQKEIDNYENRVKALIDLLDTQLANAFLNARKKHRFNNPITVINNNACGKCRFGIDNQSTDLVDQARVIINCSQCERLFIPKTA